MRSSRDDEETVELSFANDGATPNNPHFSLLLYRGALDLDRGHAGASIESMFGANGWDGFWRNGVYPYHHYHSTCHEALGVASGWAEIRFGGEHGETVRLEAGDVAVLPAGTGHKKIDASADFLIVGAYPSGQPYDMIRAEDRSAHHAAVERIAAVPVPATDPVFGEEGGLRTRWPRPG